MQMPQEATVELLIDISRKTFIVGRPFMPKLDEDGRQKRDRRTGAPLNSAQLIVMDERGADTINVTIAGDPPQLEQGQPATPVNLVALPWAANGRSGIAFRADAVRPFATAKSA
jgi:hypothetical protein